MKRILVVGSSNTDLVVRVPSIPRPGETILGGEFQTFPGGKGANQAVAAARAGGDVLFIAAVGDDAYGSEAMKGYRLDNISTEDIKVCRGIPSGIAMINISESGENSIAVAPGANAELTPEDMDEAEEAFDEADILLLQLEIPLETVSKAMEISRDLGTRVILNPAPAAELPDEILARTHLITPNESEAERLTGISVKGGRDAARAASLLHNKGIATVIITLGETGAFLSDPGSGISKIIHGFRVDAVDTTAAGDVFNGNLAVALAEGRELEEAVRTAHAAAALSVMKLGAQSSIPRKEEIDFFLKERYKMKNT